MNLSTCLTLSNQELLQKFLLRGKPPCDYERQLLGKYKERVKAIFEGKIIAPYYVEIQPTSSCNLNCCHCFGKALTKKRLENIIDKEKIDILANRVQEFENDDFKVEVITFCGTTGEPLVNPATLYGIQLFKSLGKTIKLYSNGLYLDKDYKGKKYLDYVLYADELFLSLDAASEETFVKIKGRYGFDRIVTSLKELNNKRKKINPNFTIIVSYVVNKKNYGEILKAAELVKELGVDEFNLRVDFTNPLLIKNLADEIIPRINETQKLESKNFKVMPIYSDNEIGGDCSAFNSYGRRCFNQHFWSCIGPNCELYACGHRTYHGVESYGSLLKHSFKFLWNSKKRLNNLALLPDSLCKFCSPSSSRRNTFMTFLYKTKFEFS